ncbi:MAG: hypothetical protein OXT67_12035 [Zetaproteobacteria bacterium]|nr:hypothetical protein [Zetaproteobacteria bacterium]
MNPPHKVQPKHPHKACVLIKTIGGVLLGPFYEREIEKLIGPLALSQNDLLLYENHAPRTLEEYLNTHYPCSDSAELQQIFGLQDTQQPSFQQQPIRSKLWNKRKLISILLILMGVFTWLYGLLS